MQSLTVEFASYAELQETWVRNFANGFLFVATTSTLPLNTEIHLCLRLTNQPQGIFLPARSVQTLAAGPSQKSGMVMEILGFAQFQQRLTQILNRPESLNELGTVDFTDLAKGMTHRNPDQENCVQQWREFWQNIDGKSHYDVLGVDSRARDADIEAGFHKLIERLDLEETRFTFKMDETKLLHLIRERVTKAKEVLTDPAKRRTYDYSHASAHTDKGSRSPRSGPPFAVPSRENLEKAQRIFAQALKSQAQGDLAGALNNAKIAHQLIPDNRLYGSTVAELEKKVPQQPSEVQKRNEQIQRSKDKAITRGKKLDWTE